MSGRAPAEKMFWGNPELLDKLISYLDVQSVSELAQAHQLTAQVLQENTVTWDKLVKGSCPYYEHTELPVDEDLSLEERYHDWVEEKLSTHQTNISHLTRILKRMENSKVPLLELLHDICERFPPVLLRPAEENGRPIAFHLTCPCKRSHSVTLLGLLLLEKIEGALKSAEQGVEEVYLWALMEPWFSALVSRVSRQRRPLKKVEADRFLLWFDPMEALDHKIEKLFSLQHKCQKLTIGEIGVWGDFNDDGEPRRCAQDFWAKMARVFEVDNHGVELVSASRYDFQGGRREDLRVIWDAIAAYADGYSSFYVTEVYTLNSSASIKLAWNSEELKEEQWVDFQMVLDRPLEQWPIHLKQQLEYEDDDDTESETEDSEDF